MSKGRSHNIMGKHEYDSVIICANCPHSWHSDIKPENILFCMGKWKIADPGFAHIVAEDDAMKDEEGIPVISLSGGTMAYGDLDQLVPQSLLISDRSSRAIFCPQNACYPTI
jgi:hypothetical protein